jgi:hypothetical protein
MYGATQFRWIMRLFRAKALRGYGFGRGRPGGFARETFPSWIDLYALRSSGVAMHRCWPIPYPPFRPSSGVLLRCTRMRIPMEGDPVTRGEEGGGVEDASGTENVVAKVPMAGPGGAGRTIHCAPLARVLVLIREGGREPLDRKPSNLPLRKLSYA